MGHTKYFNKLIHLGGWTFHDFLQFFYFWIVYGKTFWEYQIKVRQSFDGERIIWGKFVWVVAEILVKDHRVKIFRKIRNEQVLPSNRYLLNNQILSGEESITYISQLSLKLGELAWNLWVIISYRWSNITQLFTNSLA